MVVVVWLVAEDGSSCFDSGGGGGGGAAAGDCTLFADALDRPDGVVRKRFLFSGLSVNVNHFAKEP